MTDEDRVVVKTYVPPNQKAAWQEDADDLDMSQSEFLRSMVQAGRSDFLTGHAEGGSTNATPGGSDLEDRVFDVLDSGDAVSWEELVDELSGNFEDRLDDAVQALSDDGQIRYEPRRDGYVRQNQS